MCFCSNCQQVGEQSIRSGYFIIVRYFGITMDEFFNYRLDALDYKERFVRFMEKNGVLRFGEFKLRSGRISPYFINTGNYASASQIARLGEFYAECIHEHNIQGNLLVANTYKEVPILISTSMALFHGYGIDVSYNMNPTNDKPLAEKLSDGTQRVTWIKDTLTSGKSLKENLQNTGSIYGSDVIVSVDRKERSDNYSWSARHEIERRYGVKVHAIVSVDDIIRAMQNGIIGGREHLEAMIRYQEQYGEK